MRSTHVALVCGVLLALVACSPQAEGDTSPVAPQLAKPGPAGDALTSTFVVPLGAVSGLRGDGDFLRGDSSVYAAGECGVVGQFFYGETASGDARVQTDNPAVRDRRCAQYPREIRVDYGDGVVLLAPGAINVNRLQTPDFAIAIGETVRRGLNVADARCGGLRWKQTGAAGESFAGDSVLVTRIDARTWRIESQPYPNDRANCAADPLTTFHIPVRFTVIASRDLPVP